MPCAGRIGAHGHLSHIDVAIAHEHHAQVLLLGALACCGKLSSGTHGRCLGGLSAGIGIHLGIQHQHIDILAGGQHVIQAAEADIIGPAVAAEGPHGLFAQELLVLQDKCHRCLVLRVAIQGFQGFHQIVRHLAGDLGVISAVQIGLAGVRSHTGILQGLHGSYQLTVDSVVRFQEAVVKLGGVLEQRLLPGSTEAALILAFAMYMRSPNSWVTIFT